MRIFNTTLHTKLFLSYSLLIAIIVAIYIATFYVFFTSEIKKRLMEANGNVCYRLSSQIDTELEKMDVIAKNIIFSNDVRKLFFTSIYPGRHEELQANQLLISEKIFAVIGPSFKVKQVILVAFDERFVCIKGYSSVIEHKDVTSGSIEWIDEAKNDLSGRIILPPYISIYGDQYPVFSLIRAFPAFIGSSSISYLEIQQEYSSLANVVLSHSLARGDITASKYSPEVYIFDGMGRLVYPFGADQSMVEQYRLFSRKMTKSSVNQEMYNPDRKTTEIISYVKSDYSGWQVMMIDSEQYFKVPISIFTREAFWGGFLVLLLALLMSYLIAKAITAPIRKVHSHIKSLNPVTLTTSTPAVVGGGFNELDELNITFQNLCEALRQSVDEAVTARAYVLQAKLLALQSQMNPHFLYNTLSTISIIAEEANVPRIVNMILQLTDMLDYISSDSAQLVPLRKEIEHTNNFLGLMRIRYEDQLKVEMDVSAELLDLLVPKLIVQPLVENWSKYGMSDALELQVSIQGRKEGNTWFISVSDNGSGFSDDILKWLHEQIKLVNLNVKIPDLKINKMGLLNIYIRLKYLYGDNCIFRISNQASGGGIVMIGGSYDV